MTATIFALASGAGRAGVAVIRVSGSDAARAFLELTGRNLPEARRMTLARLSDPRDKRLLDEALAAWFPGPDSFTGEDVVEFHLHGGRAVIAAILETLAALPGFRPAEPGEFTRRAFEKGKLDLTAAEGLADLVNAETEAQRRQAFRQMQGELGALYESWRNRLVRALAHLEASIDFSDEELPAGLLDGIAREATELRATIAAHLDDRRRGERLRDGIHVAILGAPNAGKSSLLNRLARRDAAIVSEIAGTTRDVVEVHLDLGGYPLVVADTAGLRDGGDPIEREGVRRARLRAEEADLKLAVFDAALWPAVDASTARMVDDSTIVVLNKTDLRRPPADARVGERPSLGVSARTGEGMETVSY
jgi:tRNA modification GTPase